MDLLETALGEACARDPALVLVLLFGSIASGRARPDSDLDVAVAESAPLTWQRKADLIARFADVSGRPVDLVDLRTAPGALRRQVFRSGRWLLCRDRGLYGELLRQTLYDAADFQPVLQRILAARRTQWLQK